MKSIKPGRGPSRRAAAGSVFGIVFGLLWTILAASMTAGAGLLGIIFPLFGLCFVGIGIYHLMYHAKNAAAEPKERDSLLEIVDSREEAGAASDAAFCPWCGEKLGEDYQYCPKCGKKLP